MKKLYALFSAAACIALQSVLAQAGSVSLFPPIGDPVAYPSITAAYAAIPTPLGGNYLIQLQPTYNGSAETYPISLADKGLNAGGPTITIRPAPSNNGEMIQRTTPAAGVVLQFDGADNIIIDGRPGGVPTSSSNYLTIYDPYQGSNINSNIEMINGANNNVIQYVRCIAADAIASGAGSRIIQIGAGSPATGGNNNDTIAYCIIQGGQRGIQDSGYNATIPNSGTVVMMDTVRNFGFYGIIANSNSTNIRIQNNYVSLDSYNVPVVGTTVSLIGIRQQSLGSGVSNILNNTISLVSTSIYVSNMNAISDLGAGTENIIGNTIIAVSTPSNTSAATNFVIGINVSALSGATSSIFNISRNKISGLSSAGTTNIRGMSLFPSAGSTLNVNNNFVAIPDVNANASAIFGVLFGNTTGVAYNSNVFYNSIRIGGTAGAANAGHTYGIYKGSTTAGSFYNQRNNIVIVDRTGGVSGTSQFIGFLLASTAGTNTVDYNTYFASDPANGYAAGGWNGSIYRNTALAAYKASAAPQEQNANFANVTFVSATDLHLAPPSSTATTLYGAPIATLTADIDMQTRSATTPFQGADEPTTPLPVSLFSFTGEGKGNYNLLQWSTVTETNNRGFDLERSADGRNFTSLSFIPTKAVNGNSSLPLNYSFSDLKPLGTKGYYRLKQTDNDGKISYSSIVVINGKAPLALSIAGIYPNPVINSLSTVVKTPINRTVSLVVTDAAGKILLQQTKAIQAGENMLMLQTATFTTGMYILTVRDLATNEMVSTRFVK